MSKQPSYLFEGSILACFFTGNVYVLSSTSTFINKHAKLFNSYFSCMHTYFNFIIENISQENNLMIQFIKIPLTIFNFQTLLRQAANILSDDLIKRWTWFLADYVR